MPNENVHCCVTSPPYYGLRDYGMEGQIGREAAPEEYIAKLTEIFSYSDKVPGQAGVQGLNRPRKAGEIKENNISPVRNCRDVWLINTVPYRGKHFAAYPPKLAERCILAGCPEGGIVLDPFLGSGTTGVVAAQNGRHYIGIELNEEYCSLAGERIGGGYENRAD